MKWLLSLIFFIAQVSSAQSVIFPGPGNAAGGGAAGGITYGTFSLAANGWNWCYDNAGTNTSITVSLGSSGGASQPCGSTGGANPTHTDVIVLVFFTSGTYSSVSDTIGDGVAWNQCSTTHSVNGEQTLLLWKQVGATVTGRTVTVTLTGAAHMALIYGEGAVTSGTAGLDGTPTYATATSTNPDPGAITTSSTSSWVIGYSSNSGAEPTVGTGYTSRFSTFWFNADSVEDRITTSSGSYDPNWTSASQTWGAAGCALQAH